APGRLPGGHRRGRVDARQQVHHDRPTHALLDLRGHEPTPDARARRDGRPHLLGRSREVDLEIEQDRVFVSLDVDLHGFLFLRRLGSGALLVDMVSAVRSRSFEPAAARATSWTAGLSAAVVLSVEAAPVAGSGCDATTSR